MANNAAGLAGYFKSGRFIPSPFSRTSGIDAAQFLQVPPGARHAAPI